MLCEYDNIGETLNELVNKLLLFEPFINNVHAQIKLLKERTRISENEVGDKKLSLMKILPFNAKNLKTIEVIPLAVSQIVYNYDFSTADVVVQ